MFIQFQEIKLKLIILLVYPFGILSARILQYYFQNNPYFYLFLFFISHYFALFILFFYKIKMKPKKATRTKGIEIEKKSSANELLKLNETSRVMTIQDIDLIVNENQNTLGKEKVIRIIFIGFLYFISYVFFYYSSFITKTNFYGNISMITEILYFSLFNRLILGIKIYSHHLFSMILITLCILSLYILLYIKYIETNEWNPSSDFIFPTILNFIVYLIFCYQLVKAKYYIEKYFISIYKLIFFLGTLGLILLLIFEPISFFIPCDYETICYDGHLAGFISGFKQLSGIQDGLKLILTLILLFLTTFGLWLTVIYLSPSHFLTSDSIITLGINIIIDCFSENLDLLKNPLFYILSLLTIFGCLVYNEIIILNICNLNHNTRNEIIKRQHVEMSSKFEDVSDLTDDIEPGEPDRKSGGGEIYE